MLLVSALMFREAGASATEPAGSAKPGEIAAGQQADAKSKAQAFITQLEKQRNEQLAEIDKTIEELQAFSENPDAAEGQNDDGEAAAVLLASLRSNRQSIMSEYEAMITAARQRIE